MGGRLAAGRGARIPRTIGAVVPRLPDDLDYRIVGADLVLLDLRTNAVVDALRNWRER